MSDRTLCMMEIHPKLIEARKKKAEYYRMNAAYFQGMANAYPGNLQQQQMMMASRFSSLVGGLFGYVGDIPVCKYPQDCNLP